MHLVAIHLKDIDRIEVQVLNQVVEMQVGAEGGPLGVEGDGPAFGDVAAAHGCLRSAEITEETILEVRCQACPIPGDCWEE